MNTDTTDKPDVVRSSEMKPVFINCIATAVPDFDIHSKFIEYCPRLMPDKRSIKLFQRMAERAQIEHRYSFLQPHPDEGKLDVEVLQE